jgi:hypothetical protein
VAIETNPRHVESLYHYALLLEEVKKDYDQAEMFYLRGESAAAAAANKPDC